MMGAVYRPTFTKPLRDSAEIFIRKGERFARWRDGRTGKTRTAPATTGRFFNPFDRRGSQTGNKREAAVVKENPLRLTSLHLDRVAVSCRSSPLT
jgi:hypothetical protein